MPIDEKRKNIDEIYKWETKDYKKDKCKSVKRIAFHITNVFPGFLHIVDEQCLGNHYWGGGKYTHLLPINSDKETIIKKVRDIYEYKEGHLPGTSEEEKKKYRVIQKCN